MVYVCGEGRRLMCLDAIWWLQAPAKHNLGA
jgi:hypothetical protein